MLWFFLLAVVVVLNEPRISFSALARREGVHISTVWRWCLRGCKGHVLESFSIGGKKFTTLPAYERWVAAINDGPVANGETPRQQQRRVDRAEREAEQLGV